jgi:hypothetical protein
MARALCRQPLRDFLVHVDDLNGRQRSLGRGMLDGAAARANRGKKGGTAAKRDRAKDQADRLHH